VAEGAPLLREYAGKNLHPGFESLSLRQILQPPSRAASFFPPREQRVSDFAGILLALLSFAATFGLARFLSRGWRKRKQQREQATRLAGESRQVRRARERRQK